MRCSIRASAIRTEEARLVTINYDSELRRAGANADTFWRRVRFFARRYVLGTVGLVIMILFVFAALFADLICI
jgi:peptide/nickel transport system permease protein